MIMVLDALVAWNISIINASSLHNIASSLMGATPHLDIEGTKKVQGIMSCH